MSHTYTWRVPLGQGVGTGLVLLAILGPLAWCTATPRAPVVGDCTHVCGADAVAFAEVDEGNLRCRCRGAVEGASVAGTSDEDSNR